MGKEIMRKGEIGLLEWVDEDTGIIVAQQAPNAKKKKAMESGKLEIGRASQVNLVKNGLGDLIADPKSVTQSQLTIYPYHIRTARVILDYISEGMTIKAVSEIMGMPPYRQIMYWMRSREDFGAEMKAAKAARAEHFHDQALEIASNTTSLKSKGDKLKIDTLKWGAKVGDSAQFADSVTHKGDSLNPIQIIVDTGIRRPKDIDGS